MATKQDVNENVDVLVPALIQRIAHVEAYLTHLKNALNGTGVIANISTSTTPEPEEIAPPTNGTVKSLMERLTA